MEAKLKMNTSYLKFVALWLAFSGAMAQAAGPASADLSLSLEKSIELPKSIKGHFDHFAVDAAGHRIFATAVDDRLVAVIDFESGVEIGEIRDVQEPRATVYRPDRHRLYVSDGVGLLRIYDSETLKPVKVLPLSVDADPMAYDPASERLFVVSGGEKANETFSVITIVDTKGDAIAGEIHQDGIELEGMTVEGGGRRIFVNNRDRNEIDVFDRLTSAKVAVWPVTSARKNTVSVIDEKTHRLIVAGHNGELGVINSDTGGNLQTLPIGDGADDIAFDVETRTIFVASGGGNGSIDLYREDDDGDHFRRIGSTETAPGAATGRFVKERSTYLVLAPARENTAGRLLVYRVHANR